jgi:hypothetical protein
MAKDNTSNILLRESIGCLWLVLQRNVDEKITQKRKA